MKKICCLSLAFFLLLACQPAPASPLVPSATPDLTATSTPEPTVTLTPTASPTPFIPFTINTFADNVNVRNNPGYLFNVKLLVNSSDTLTVHGMSPGGEWIYVEVTPDVYGWIFGKLLYTRLPPPLPIKEPVDVQRIRAHVTDSSSHPVSGIAFALTSSMLETAARSDSLSDANGDVYFFIPLHTEGDWYLTYVGYACTSSAVDANCNCIVGGCGKVEPAQLIITLPTSEVFEFSWK